MLSQVNELVGGIMKPKKLFCYRTVIIWAIIIVVALIGMLIPIILFPQKAWFLIIGIFLLLLAAWALIATGFFFPIMITEENVKYRGHEYEWTQIKITAYPALRKSFRYGYYLVFGENYLSGKALKTQIRRGFWVYLEERSLLEILKYYNEKIQVINAQETNEKELIKSTSKLKQMINDHNKQFQE